MNIAQASRLKTTLAMRGVTLSPAGDGVRVTPSSLITDADREAIRCHKADLLFLFRLEAFFDAWWQAGGPSFDIGCEDGLVRYVPTHVRDRHQDELEAFEGLLGITCAEPPATAKGKELGTGSVTAPPEVAPEALQPSS